ncbi:MAG TPA: acyl-CoA carboxylase subunit epsilon [Lacisediminihabitans sp.]|nr:acyl-CoA carboxylase subunit epsilon [Lacisediminihabitans sp.]HXD61872.1 acyl-CoA carboxylase subunit epsilon [Lacisediminihabitans sp.]
MTESTGTASEGADFTVLSGKPSAAELAAVTAVLSAAIADAQTPSAAARDPQRTAWQRAQRPIRMPLSRGAGTWRGFTG